VKTLSVIPLPAVVFALFVTFLYGLLKFFIPTLPFSEDQIGFILNSLLALLGVIVTARAQMRGLI
jgi:hypothetical protein